MIGTKGTHGVLNGRSRLGLLRRTIQTPAQTITNASRVPMVTMSPSRLMGRDAARKATQVPTIRVEIHGVRNFGCTALKTPGKSQSRDMEKKTRDCPSNMTTIVELKPMSAPILTTGL